MRTVHAQQLGELLRQLNAGNLAAAAACIAKEQATPADPAVCQLRAVVTMRSGQPQVAQNAAAQSLRVWPSHAGTMLIAAQAAMALA